MPGQDSKTLRPATAKHHRGESTMMPSSRLHSRDKPDARPSSPAAGGKPDGSGELQIGRVLGKLLLTERLGAGAMGVVFRAFHQSLGIPVAVKVLRAEEVEADPSLYEQL